jgi:hypothetical protein
LFVEAKLTFDILKITKSSATAIGRGLEPLDATIDPGTRLNWW